jgi:hypothetical protein
VLQVHAATAQHQGIFELQRGLEHIIGVDQNGVALAAAAGGNIIFRIALRTVFKTKTKIALFAVTIVIVKPALAAAAEVFNQRAVGGGFSPEGIGKATAGQKTCTGTLSLLPFGEPTSGA